MQGFSAQRVLCEEFQLTGFDAKADGSQWSCELEAVVNYLGAKKDWTANITAIMGTPDYEFLSLAKLPGEEADFHQPEAFLGYADLPKN